MGVGLLAGAANVIMQLVATGCRLRRDGEPGRERTRRPPPDQAGPHHVHLPCGGAGNGTDSSRRRTGERSTVRTLRCTRPPTAQSSTTRSTRAAAVGGGCLYKGVVDIYKSSSARWTTQPPSHYREGIALGTMLQVPARCGLRTGRRSTATGSSRWPRSTSTSCPRYLWPIAAGRIAARSCRRAVQRGLDDVNLLITTGFLPQRFRDEMRLEWDAGSSAGSTG